jgi:hypothetical protein
LRWGCSQENFDLTDAQVLASPEFNSLFQYALGIPANLADVSVRISYRTS